MNRVAQYDVDAALDRQKDAWLRGCRPSVHDLLRDSSLPSDHNVLLDFIYNEIVVREELGESPSLAEYVACYPDLDEDLKLHFEVHRAVLENQLAETNRVFEGESPTQFDVDPQNNGSGLADYDIISELGRGGMGIVYKARHRRLKRLVALKMIQPDRNPSIRELARFRAEAEAIARLQHTNIVQIFEVGVDQGKPFFALELADKGTLQQKLLEYSYQPRAAAELIETLARAIHHAHENRIVHRDLKPANVLFTADGTPKITDFGLAKLLDSEANEPRDATRSGEPIGTPRYMSPEQASGQVDQIGPRTDVYALGTLLYECMTGQAPFVSSSVVATVDRIRHQEPTPPRRLQRSIPRDLETICLSCLRKDSAQRYGTAKALAEDLRRFLDGEAIKARRTPVLELAWMWCRRRPAVATLLATVATIVVAGVLFLVIRQNSERQRIATLRTEVAALVTEGQATLLRGEALAAKERFQDALAKVHAEPALIDHELGVRGWLDHCDRAASEQLRKQRRIPPPFDQRRDEAFVLCLFSDPARPESMRLACEAVAGTLEFTPAADLSWRAERETLLVLQSDLALREGLAAKALEIVDSGAPMTMRLGVLQRAAILERLDQETGAAVETKRASTMAPQINEKLFQGLKHAQAKDFDSAISLFDQVLANHPEHYLARLLQCACFVESKRAAEAKVALTACIGQRATCPWSHLLRSRAYLQLGDLLASAQDLIIASEMPANDAAYVQINQIFTALKNAVAALSPERKDDFWNAIVLTRDGRQSIRQTAFFARK